MLVAAEVTRRIIGRSVLSADSRGAAAQPFSGGALQENALEIQMNTHFMVLQIARPVLGLASAWTV